MKMGESQILGEGDFEKLVGVGVEKFISWMDF
jgi:hypothetical protein